MCRTAPILLAALPLLALACDPEGRGGAEDVLDQVALATHAQVLTGRLVELTAEVPVGAGLAEAATAIGLAAGSALPCLQVAQDGATVTLDFGSPEAPCTLSGRPLRGVASVTVLSTSAEQVAVHHEWAGLGDGEVAVDGSADVTWAAGTAERRVVDQLVWRDVDSDDEALGGGERTQRALDGGETLALDGTAAWTDEDGAWDLTAEGVEVGWGALVPRTGTHTLVDPTEDTWTVTWERLEPDAFRVAVRGPGTDFDFVLDVPAEGP